MRKLSYDESRLRLFPESGTQYDYRIHEQTGTPQKPVDWSEPDL